MLPLLLQVFGEVMVIGKSIGHYIFLESQSIWMIGLPAKNEYCWIHWSSAQLGKKCKSTCKPVIG